MIYERCIRLKSRQKSKKLRKSLKGKNSTIISIEDRNIIMEGRWEVKEFSPGVENH